MGEHTPRSKPGVVASALDVGLGVPQHVVNGPPIQSVFGIFDFFHEGIGNFSVADDH